MAWRHCEEGRQANESRLGSERTSARWATDHLTSHPARSHCAPSSGGYQLGAERPPGEAEDRKREVSRWRREGRAPSDSAFALGDDYPL